MSCLHLHKLGDVTEVEDLLDAATYAEACENEE